MTWKPELDALFTQQLHALDEAQVISLERVMHYGTKIRARAGVDSFRRQNSVEERLAARQARLEQARKELEKIQQARHPQYAPHFFIFQPEGNPMQGPGGKPLDYIGQSHRPKPLAGVRHRFMQAST